MQRSRIEELVLSAMRAVNAARTPDQQLAVAADARIFGGGSPLDSLGLVALLIDIEDALLADGVEVVLGDERAMSASRSPFRDVPSLVAFIDDKVNPNP